jgi:hypothetical protein
MLPMLRPLIVAGLLIKALAPASLSTDKLDKVVSHVIIIVFFLGCVNFLGVLDSQFYQSFNNMWNGSARWLDERGTVASIATGDGRYSSIFPQPATAGLAQFVLLFILIMLRRHLSLILLALSVVVVIWSGIVSKSSIFIAAPPLIFIFFLFYKLLGQISRQLYWIVIFSPTLITLIFFAYEIHGLELFGDDILGSRLAEGSYLVSLMMEMSLKDYLFGIYQFESRGLRVGDNAILIRVSQVGMIISMAYLIVLGTLIYGLIVRYANPSHRTWLLAFYSTIFFAELGFTSFSQPGVVVLVFAPVYFSALIWRRSADFPSFATR